MNINKSKIVDVTLTNFEPPALLPKPSNMFASPVYGVHIFWAKKPSNVIAECIKHFSNPGEIVLDPFGGYGVVSIEALKLNRKVVILDLDPLAVFLTRMLAIPYSPEELMEYRQTSETIKNEVMEEINQLYETKCPNCNDKAIILTTIFDTQTYVKNLRKRNYVPRKIRYECPHCGSDWKKPSREDIIKIREIEKQEPPYWYPMTKLPHNTRINVHEDMGIPDLYTKRNFISLSYLRNAIFSLTDDKIKQLMKFTLSGIIRSASKTTQEKGGGQAQFFYIANKGMAERNVLDLFRRKRDDVLRCKREVWKLIGHKYREAKDFSELENDNATILIRKWDVTKLTELIPESSIDYVHTDPPYADQVPYLELSLPWIAWLELEPEVEFKKDLEAEIILTDSPERPQKRKGSDLGLKNYHANLGEAMNQIYKVLKPQHWASIWYCCSQEEYWRALIDNLNLIGLERRGRPNIIVRTIKTLKYAITRAKKPLGKVRNCEHLVHCLKTGMKLQVMPVTEREAITLFFKTAEREIRRRGSVDIDEILIPFYAECLNKYGNPPPDLDYVGMLKIDPRFEVRKEKERIDNKYLEVVKLKLKGYKHPGKITTYLEGENGN